MRKGDKVRFLATGRDYEVTEMGYLRPRCVAQAVASGGGRLYYGRIKTVADTRRWDTVTLAQKPADDAVAGFKPVKPMVFAGIFPTDTSQYEHLRDSLAKFNMNDAAFVINPDTLTPSGLAFAAGFWVFCIWRSSRNV